LAFLGQIIFKSEENKLNKMDFIPAAIADYAEKHTTADTPLLHALERETHLTTLSPRMLSGHLQGRFLSMISRMMQPSCILEIGTFTGYSALCLAEGLTEGGVLYALEADDELETIINKYIKASDHKNRIQLIIGDALRIIPTLDAVFDIVFIDAAKREYPAYYEAVIGKVRAGGLIIADNVLWSGKVVQDKKDEDTAIIDAFNKMIQDDSRVDNILLPLRDGLMVAMKRG
jgi:caffeoyl-CoA O-methyltransferase